MRSNDVGRLILLSFGIFALAGCLSEGERYPHPDGESAWEEAQGVEISPAETVAVVDGRRLSRADLQLQWEENPEWSAREALQALVEREVLVGQALEDGAHRRPEVRFARKQGMVSALLKEQVEEKAEIDEEKRPQFEEMVQKMRRAPAGIRASHLVILLPEEVKGEEREALLELAREIAEVVREELGEEVDDDALREKAEELNREVLAQGLSAAVNEHLRFPRVDAPFTREQLPSGWTTVVGEFAEGAQAMADAGRLGELSEPIRSSYGWHLIRVDEVFEERPVEPVARSEFVEDQLLLDGQVQRLQEELRRWLQESKVELYPDRLEEGGGLEAL